MHVVDSLKDYFEQKVLVMKKKCPKVHQFDLLALNGTNQNSQNFYHV